MLTVSTCWKVKAPVRSVDGLGLPGRWRRSDGGGAAQDRHLPVDVPAAEVGLQLVLLGEIHQPLCQVDLAEEQAHAAAVDSVDDVLALVLVQVGEPGHRNDVGFEIQLPL